MHEIIGAHLSFVFFGEKNPHKPKKTHTSPINTRVKTTPPVGKTPGGVKLTTSKVTSNKELTLQLRSYLGLMNGLEYLEDHPKTCKCLVTPIYKPWKGHLEGEELTY